MNDSTIVLNARGIAERLPMHACIGAVENAFLQLGTGAAQPPSTLSIHAAEGTFHIKAGMLMTPRGSYFVAKTNGNFPGNPVTNGLPTIQGVAILCDATNGRVLALLDSLELTARRTAAATAVAARYLARTDAESATIVGCGVQAPSQIEALSCVLPQLRNMRLFDLDVRRAQALAESLRSWSGLTVEVVEDYRDAVASSDVCVTCTTSHEFILDASDVGEGMFIAGVGVDNEHKRELAPSLLARAKVVTDLTKQCVQMGDLHHAIDAGAMNATAVWAELGAIVAGAATGRTRDDDLFVFDSTGLALQDVAAAAAIFEAL